MLGSIKMILKLKHNTSRNSYEDIYYEYTRVYDTYALQ